MNENEFKTQIGIDLDEYPADVPESMEIRNEPEPMVKEGAETAKVVGIDIGTSKIVVAQKINGKVDYTSQLNAFIPVEYSKLTEGVLKQSRIRHYRKDDILMVYGDGAEVYAEMLSQETRRPMRSGLLNPGESNSNEVIRKILNDLVTPTKIQDKKLCFSIPGIPSDYESDIIYHEAIIRRHLEERGYKAKSINEGLSVVFSELANENFTGFGISAGGGMCNVCLAYLSIPLISFSIKKGGDYIDDSAAKVTNENSMRVRHIKETELDLNRKPKNDIEEALHIYYEDMIKSLIKTMKDSIREATNLPKVNRAIPIILSGGSAKPTGFKEKFESFFMKEHFPIDVSEIRMAKNPLFATAKGALIAAMYEE